MMLPYRELRTRGHDVSFIDKPSDPRVKTADVLVFQRQHGDRHHAQMREVQARGGRVVFEFDDSFHHLPHDNPNASEYRNGTPATKGIERFIADADLVIVSTIDLAEEYRRFRGDRPMVVCPNAVADEHLARFRPAELTGAPKREGQLRIGWAGSATHFGDLRSILKPLAKVMDEFPEARFILGGLGHLTKPGERRADGQISGADQIHPWIAERHRSRVEYLGQTFKGTTAFRPGLIDNLDQLATVAYYEMLHAADIDFAIAPLVPSTFTRCKSPLKAIEYGMMGIPAILTSHGPYRRYVRDAESAGHGAPCYLASDERDWYRHLRTFATSAEHRAWYAQANIAHVEREFVMSKMVDRWEYALSLIAGAQEAVA
jgi:glycosyltransferase involved in cell wall biosynthesis